MAITNYSELQTAVGRWINRGDLVTLYPDFIALAEERMNRVLRVRQMEMTLAETAIEDDFIAVPDGTVGVKTMWLAGYERSPLKAQTSEFIVAHRSNGLATHWAWEGNAFQFDGSGTVTGILYERIPSLSDTETINWLLSLSPSSYLFGTLAEAYMYIKDNDSAQMWNARFEQTLADIAGTDKRDTLSGPLQARAR